MDRAVAMGQDAVRVQDVAGIMLAAASQNVRLEISLLQVKDLPDRSWVHGDDYNVVRREWAAYQRLLPLLTGLIVDLTH
eukprot:gene17749-16900_t